MSSAPSILDVSVEVPDDRLVAGEWQSLTFVLRRPESCTNGVRIRNIDCKDRNIRLANDLFQRDVEIRPGESYCVTLPVHSARPLRSNLDQLYVEYVEPERPSELLFLGSRTLSFRPSLALEVGVRVEPICSYGEDTKVLLTFEHQGATTFADLHIELGPKARVRACKQIRRPFFRPGEREQIEAIVAPGELEIHLTAVADSEPVTARKDHRIPSLTDRTVRPLFRFLEPHRLSTDRISLYRMKGRSRKHTIRPRNGAYPVHGGESYQLVIQPQHNGVTRIKLRDVPQKIVVRSEEPGGAGQPWRFLLDVTADSLMSQSERLFYDVEGKDTPATGEVHLTLRPARWKHATVAVTAGALLTAQGIAGLYRALHTSHFSGQNFLGDLFFSREFQINLGFVLVIPALALTLYLVDRLQYRLVRP